MTETVEQPRQETAPASTPDSSAPPPPTAPTDSRSVDDYLAEYEASVGKESPAPNPEPDPTPEQVDALLVDDGAGESDGLQDNGVAERLAALQAENDQFRDHAWREQERTAFIQYAADLQSRVGEHVPNDFCETQ